MINLFKETEINYSFIYSQLRTIVFPKSDRDVNNQLLIYEYGIDTENKSLKRYYMNLKSIHKERIRSKAFTEPNQHSNN